jgi:hypothetical protein
MHTVAHPTILLQYCKKNDIQCDALKHYVNNRDEFIKTIMNDYQLEKRDIKQLFLSIMNGDKHDGITDTFCMKFKSELECKRMLHMPQLVVVGTRAFGRRTKGGAATLPA